MSASLPIHVLASTAVARRARFEGTLPIARLKRLADCLADPAGELMVRLQAGTDASGAAHLSGSVSGSVKLLCQRCLRDYAQPLDLGIDLRLVRSDAEEARLIHECEPYQVVDDRLLLHEIVEEEAMLALPLAPRCSRPDCAEAESHVETGAVHPGAHLG